MEAAISGATTTAMIEAMPRPNELARSIARSGVSPSQVQMMPRISATIDDGMWVGPEMATARAPPQKMMNSMNSSLSVRALGRLTSFFFVAAISSSALCAAASCSSSPESRSLIAWRRSRKFVIGMDGTDCSIRTRDGSTSTAPATACSFRPAVVNPVATMPPAKGPEPATKVWKPNRGQMTRAMTPTAIAIPPQVIRTDRHCLASVRNGMIEPMWNSRGAAMMVYKDSRPVSSTRLSGTQPALATMKMPSIAMSRLGTLALDQMETISPSAMNNITTTIA